MTTVINYLTRVVFGQGAITGLSGELQQLGSTAPLVITDRGVCDAGLVSDALHAGGLPADLPVFKETPENPTEAAVEQALNFYRQHRCDGIIALGGGSSIDLAKGVSLLATHEPPLRQYAVIDGGATRISPDMVPLVAIPTTAGTGSEVGRASLITMHDGRKLGFLSPYLIPSVAVCDPELTRSLPRMLTAGTGMDAIAHCVETYLSPRDNPPAEAIALDGLQRASGSLPAAVSDGSNMKARAEMMMAALEGALAFQKGLGAVHSISHALGGMEGMKLHHGTLNAVLLPPVLRFNQPYCDQKFVRIRGAMGLAPGADVAKAFDQLNADLGMPRTLTEMGVEKSVLDRAAEWAYEDHSTASNPRPAQRADFRQIMLEVLD